MMSEYIKREDAIKAVNHLQEQFQLNVNELEFGIILKDVFRDVIPSADVEPVRHGHWIRESVGSDNSSEGYFKISMAECSECGTCVIGKPNYCPNCGARMDGGGDNA